MECVDFGAEFNQEVSIHLAKFINGPIHQEKRKIENVKLRCQALLQEALSLIQKRLPDSVDVFKRLLLLNPNKVLSQTLKGGFKDLPFVHLMEDNINVTECQYRKINLVEWREEEFLQQVVFLTILINFGKVWLSTVTSKNCYRML